MAASKLKLCDLGTAESTEWEKLYEAAFQPFQRTPYSTLRDGMRSGQILLHTTSEETQGILCFSIVNCLNSFALLAYIATDTTKRSSGIGSKHMKQLLIEVQAKCPTAIAMVAEIESTRDKNITEEERKDRKRRLRFYQRLGFKRLKTDYKSPSYTTATPDEECELIVYPFTSSFQCTTTSDIIKEIYLKAYVLQADDSRITSLPKSDTLPNDCVMEEVEAQDQTTAPAANTSDQTAAQPTDQKASQPTDQTAQPTTKDATPATASAATSTPDLATAKADQEAKSATAPAATASATAETINPATTTDGAANSEGSVQTPVAAATAADSKVEDSSQMVPVVAPVLATAPSESANPPSETASATSGETKVMATSEPVSNETRVPSCDGTSTSGATSNEVPPSASAVASTAVADTSNSKPSAPEATASGATATEKSK